MWCLSLEKVRCLRGEVMGFGAAGSLEIGCWLPVAAVARDL